MIVAASLRPTDHYDKPGRKCCGRPQYKSSATLSRAVAVKAAATSVKVKIDCRAEQQHDYYQYQWKTHVYIGLDSGAVRSFALILQRIGIHGKHHAAHEQLFVAAYTVFVDFGKLSGDVFVESTYVVSRIFVGVCIGAVQFVESYIVTGIYMIAAMD